MRRSRKALLLAGAGAALATVLVLPASGQQQAPESLLPPGFGAPARPQPAAPVASGVAAVPPAPRATPGDMPALDAPPAPAEPEAVPDIAEVDEPPAPEELPLAAQRSLDQVGFAQGYADDVFGAADGRFLAALMRRIETPIASRWAEILLRRVLLTATPAPAGEGRADWVADRAALLLRLGEADGGSMLVRAVDVDGFSPRLRRVAIQAAFATSDPAGLCPLPDGGETIGDQPAWPMIRAMCAALSGDAATANASIGRGPQADPIDHPLAEKVVAASGAGRRAVPIDWTAVDTLTDWRFGLATALNVVIPQALLDAAPAWFQAWLARAPMLGAADRIAPARIAAVLGPFSSAQLVDLYGQVMDARGDVDTDSPSGLLRAAYRGDNDAARVTALRALWTPSGSGGAPLAAREIYAGRILTARAAATIAPSDDFDDDVGSIVGALFAAGLDRQAARWASIAARGSDASADAAWSMLAVGAEQPIVQPDAKRIERIAGRDGGAGRQRALMLVAALAGLGRMPAADAARIATDLGTNLAIRTPYADALDRVVTGGEPGTVALLVATGMQSASWAGVPAPDFFRMIQALRAIGLETEARMIAAEAVCRL